MGRALKRNNLKFYFLGYFFVAFSIILISYFLPFHLKEQGLGILEIGALFTIGIALGFLIISFIFGKILKKISLRMGLGTTSLLAFFYSFFFYISPNYIGIILSEIFGRFRKVTSGIVSDITMQYNIYGNNYRKISSYGLIVDSLAIVFGLFISVILIKTIGFRNSLLVFSVVSFLSLFYYMRIKDKERFSLKKI